jgi:single-strand DNA-binding protein
MGNKRSLNRVILIGNVGQNPEVRHIPSLDKNVAKFSLATTETYLDKNNTFQDVTEWHNVVVWGKWQVQKVERNVSKGAMVMVEGKITTRKWQDKESNATRRLTEIIAQDVVILRKADDKGAETGAKNAYPDNNYENQAPPVYDIDSDVPPDESDPF